MDCGSTVNLIPGLVVKDAEIKPTVKSLIMWNKSELKPLATCKLNLKTQTPEKGFLCSENKCEIALKDFRTYGYDNCKLRQISMP